MTLGHGRGLIAMLIAIAALTNRTFGQTSASWLTATDGSWTDPLKWSSNPNYPNNGQPGPLDHYDVVIDAVGGNYLVNLPGTNVTVDSLSVTSPNATLRQPSASFNVLGAARLEAGVFELNGSILSAGDLIVGSVMDWLGGTVTGSGTMTIAPGGAVYCRAGSSGSGGRSLYSALDNFGALNVRAGTLEMFGTAMVVNRATGVINVDVPSGTGGALLGNGSNTTVLSNLGRINVNSGGFARFRIVNSGTIHVNGAATLNAATHNNNSALSGLGTINLTGSHTLGSGVTRFAANPINLDSNSQILGNGDLEITGQLNWNGGTIGGGGIMCVAAGATLNVASGSSSRTLARRLDNAGLMRISAYPLRLDGLNTSINNLPGGQIDIAHFTFFNLSNTASIVLTNQGTTRFLPGTGSLLDQSLPGFINSGTIIADGLPLYLSSGTHLSGSTITGAATINLFGSTSSGSQSLIGPTTLVGANMNLGPGLVTGPGRLNLTGRLHWTSGTIGGTGSMTIASTGVLDVNAPGSFGSVTLSRPLFNSGVINVNSGTLQSGTTTIINEIDGVLNISPNATISLFTGTSGPPLTNNGTIRGLGTAQASALLPARMTSAGTIVAVSGLTEFNVGTFGFVTLLAGSVITGPSTIDIGRAIVMQGDVTLAGPSMLMGPAPSGWSSAWVGPGSARITGVLNWTGGGFFGMYPSGGSTPAGRLIIEAGARVEINPTTGVGLGRNADNFGSVNFNSGTLSLGSSIFVNHASGVLSIQSPRNFVGFPAALLSNSGTMNLSAASISISVPLENFGVLNIGSSSIPAPILLSPFTNGGRINGELNTGTQTVTLQSGATGGKLDGAGTTIVADGASASAHRLRQGTLAIQSGARLTLEPDGGPAVTTIVHTLTLAAPSSRLDLTDNHLVVDYDPSGPNPYTSIRGAIAAAQIFSSAADARRRVGLADNASLQLPIFGGQIVDESSVLARLTWAGDTNLDGFVDVADLGALATQWQAAGDWTEGDFNYDGVVNVADLGLVATNWQIQGSPGLADAIASFGLDNTTVPEASIALLATLLIPIISRPDKCLHAQTSRTR